jgi:hypothetical protein
MSRDFTCGTLSYNGHKGTDFALPTLAEQAQGVAVLAAADGVVTASRNDMADILQNMLNAPDITGRDCGNGMVIRHSDGWETQYCHMAQGSLTVRPGDAVTAGQSLGMVGLSGNTEFPHLHLSVRHNGDVVDPFAPTTLATCGTTDTSPLWDTALQYIPGGLISSGLTGDSPSYVTVKSGAELAPIRPHSPLIGWTFFFGTQDGDQIQLVIDGPDGTVHSTTQPLRQQAQAFQFSGRRAPPGGWPAGLYTLTTTLLRGNLPFDTATSMAILP